MALKRNLKGEFASFWAIVDEAAETAKLMPDWKSGKVDNLPDYCPICNKKVFKLIHHINAMSDEEHDVLEVMES